MLRTLFALAVLALAPLAARAADVETRVFNINLDGSKIGVYTLAIETGAGGAYAVSAESNVRVTFLGVTAYTYNYSGQEIWRAGRVVQFQSSGKEKGKAFSVRATQDGTNLSVQANGKEYTVRGDAWLSSCWMLPETTRRNTDIAMLGSDNGTEMTGKYEFVGNEEIKVAGKTQTCAHYRVTKDVTHDVWYDGQDRMVRDAWTSNGRRTVMEITEIRR